MSTTRLLPLLFIAWACAADAQTSESKISLRWVRVATRELEKTAKFYEETLGLQEVARGTSEKHGSYIELNFGNTVAEAKANTATGVFIGQFRPDQAVDTVAHLVFYVPDTYTTVARAKSAGGELAIAPYELKMAEAIRVIAYVKDPGGNQLEILSNKK